MPVTLAGEAGRAGGRLASLCPHGLSSRLAGLYGGSVLRDGDMEATSSLETKKFHGFMFTGQG